MGEEAKLVIGKAICHDIEAFKSIMKDRADAMTLNTAAQGKPVNFMFAFEASRRIDAVRAAIAEAMASGMRVKNVENVVSSTDKKGDSYLFVVNGQKIPKRVLTPMYYLVSSDELPGE